MSEITVILPIYRECNEYVEMAIESIINQEIKGLFLFVRLDDPSNDRLKDLVMRYVNKYDFIDFKINEKNMGLASTLNLMLDEVETEYVARMDADDISLLNRIDKQYTYMKAHPDIDLCGTNIIYINDDNTEIHKKGRIPTSPDKINRSLKYVDVLCHPTFFAKSSVMKTLKYRELRYAQDYDLVCRLAENGYKLANLKEYLLRYRVGNVSENKKFEQRVTASLIKKYYSKGSLSDTDILEKVDCVINKSSKEDIYKYNHAIQINEAGVIKFKKGQYIAGSLRILQAALTSKYARSDFLNNIVYRIMCVRL